MPAEIWFTYGSHVYGTTTPLSDKDYIVITDEISTQNRNSILPTVINNIQFINWADFIHELTDCGVKELECISLLINDKIDFFGPSRNISSVKTFEQTIDNLKEFYFAFYNVKNLRSSFSHMASNSFVKAKKKCILENEDSYIGLKSLFHSIRILDFGIQIATNPLHSVTNFQSCNDIWKDLYSHKDTFNTFKNKEDEYKKFIEPWKIIYNQKHSEFKMVTQK